MKSPFVYLPESHDFEYFTPIETKNDKEEQDFLKNFRSSALYKNQVIQTPYGKKPLRYFDFTASGCFYKDIEDELNEKVLPFMSNTHTRSNTTSSIITHYFEHSYARIKHYVRALDNDILIFTGNGSTGAINRLISTMGIRIPEQLEKQYNLSQYIPEKERPIIFRSLMEHHSNDIPWRETIGKDVYVDFNECGQVSLEDLEAKLEEYKDYSIKIGTFSAASNVTGIINDTYCISKLLHKYGALAFFDYAAAGPYLPIFMQPEPNDDSDNELGYMDAVFISTHKFVGGPRAPGLLIAKKKLFTNTIPVEPGGGTVLYTSPWDHKYLDDLVAREMGGTPAIVQTIQAGLVFDLKEVVGTKRIEQIEHDYLTRAYTLIDGLPEVTVLAKPCETNLGIISIMFNKLHYNLAVSLFNDIFGIQVRGGCMCAGPYGHRLLAIEKERSASIRYQLDQGMFSVKPGWVRISFNHVTSEEEFQVLLEAIEYIAQHGNEYEARYTLVKETGEYIYSG